MDDKLYAPAFGDHNPVGFTNHYLEARNQTQFFSQNFKDYHPTSNTENNVYRDILKTNIPPNPLSNAFLSSNNIKKLKYDICNGIYQRSGGNYQISPESQSTESLLTVMMSIYLEFARHLPTDIDGQVKELNGRVLDYMIPSTISRIKEHLTYIRSHSQQPLVMNRPQQVKVGHNHRRSHDMSRTFL